MDTITKRPDVIAIDANGCPVALVEVEAVDEVSDDAVSRLLYSMNLADPPVPFGILVDLSRIQVFRWTGRPVSKPHVTLPTGSILSVYEPDFEGKRIFSDYLGTLVEAWMSDLVDNWKSDNPPGQRELEAVGLAQRLSGGGTLRQYASAA